MKLMYIILHYNRPYFVDLNVQIIRKYFPKDTSIILIDDGSPKRVLDSIKDKVDVVYRGWAHSDDSCCKNLNLAISKLKQQPLGDFVLFSEDDFLFWPSPIEIDPNQSKGEDLLDSSIDIVLPEMVETGHPIRSAVDILNTNKDIHVVQISRPVKRNVFYAGPAKLDGWKILDHKMMRKHYYTNWPFIMRSSEFFGIDLPRAGSIAKLESSNFKWFDKKFGDKSNYIVAPDRPYYFHIGYPFSLQPIESQNERRKRAFRMLQRILGTNANPEKISRELSQAYIDGNFKLNLKKISKVGLQRAMCGSLYSFARQRAGFGRYSYYLDQQQRKVRGLKEDQSGGAKWEIENFGEAKRHILKYVSKVIPPEEVQGRILVLGARWGSDIDCLKSLGYQNIIGLDIYDPPLREDIIWGDAHNISSLNEKFSMFVCYHSFEHFLHPSKVVGGIKRSILPGGYVVVVVPELSSKNAGKRNDAQIELNSFEDLKMLFKDMGFILKDACLEANSFSFKSYLFIFQNAENVGNTTLVR